MRVNGKPTDTISQKAPPGSGAKFGRSIVMGLPGRWQTHPLNTEPNRWFLCRKSQHEKSPAEAGLSRGSHQRACRAGKPTNSTARLTVSRATEKSPAEAGLSRSFSPSKRACPPELSEPDTIRGHSAELRTSAANPPTKSQARYWLRTRRTFAQKKAPTRAGLSRLRGVCRLTSDLTKKGSITRRRAPEFGGRPRQNFEPRSWFLCRKADPAVRKKPRRSGAKV